MFVVPVSFSVMLKVEVGPVIDCKLSSPTRFPRPCAPVAPRASTTAGTTRHRRRITVHLQEVIPTYYRHPIATRQKIRPGTGRLSNLRVRPALIPCPHCRPWQCRNLRFRCKEDPHAPIFQTRIHLPPTPALKTPKAVLEGFLKYCESTRASDLHLATAHVPLSASPANSPPSRPRTAQAPGHLRPLRNPHERRPARRPQRTRCRRRGLLLARRHPLPFQHLPPPGPTHRHPPPPGRPLPHPPGTRPPR